MGSNKELYKVLAQNGRTHYGYFNSLKQAVTSFQFKQNQAIRDISVKRNGGFHTLDLSEVRNIVWPVIN